MTAAPRDISTIELEPVDRIQLTILIDNVTDPLLMDQHGVARMNWPKALLGSIPRSSSQTSPERGVPDALTAEPLAEDPVREQILEAALEQFKLIGLRRTTVGDVARRARDPSRRPAQAGPPRHRAAKPGVGERRRSPRTPPR